MVFCIFSHVLHARDKNGFFAYSPYVNEINIWLKFVDKVKIIAPLDVREIQTIDSYYQHENLQFKKIKSFNFNTIFNGIRSIFIIPKIIFQIFRAMQTANHIHLRCPGNIGLLACIVQIFFPNKIKTAKYAGNWDASAKQPFSYKLQKKILSNTFLTRNMTVLVYGEWENQSKNIKSFFTATYRENEKIVTAPKPLSDEIEFLFVGSLTSSKQPLVAVQIVQNLLSLGYHVSLSIFGEGKENSTLLKYIHLHNLDKDIFVKGNLDREKLKLVYQKSHFLILPSKSEGWPKVVAEAMFWGCLPIASAVSCVPNMLDNGNRGILILDAVPETVDKIITLINNQKEYHIKVSKAMEWSRTFTLDFFEENIKKLLLK